MNKRGIYVIGLTALLMGVMLTTYTVWTQSSFTHGEPGFDLGCYCHNNGIQVFVNGTGDGNGGVLFGPFKAGNSFHLLISTGDQFATGVVPGLQLWESNQTDNAKFTISPAKVTDGSAQDLNSSAGNITALYQVTVPASIAAGYYTLTPYAQGTLLEPIEILVTAASTSTTSTTSSTTSTTSSTTSTTSSTTSTTSSTTSTTSSTTSTTSTTSSTSTTHSTSSSTTTSTTSSTTVLPTVSITSPTPGASFTGNQAYTISGTISPTPSLPDGVLIKVQLQGSFTVLDSTTAAVTSSGTFSYSTHVGGTPLWVTGAYVITATDSTGATGTTTFEYSASGTTSTTTTSTTTTPPVSTSSTTSSSTTSSTTKTTSTSASTTTASSQPPATTTVTQTITLPQSTVTSTATATAPQSTVTSTATQTVTSTVTQTTSTTPGWAYGAMVILFLVGLAIGYVVKRPQTRGS